MYKMLKPISSDEITALRKELLHAKKCFVDDAFLLKAPKSKLKWLRPHEICRNPQFIVDGFSRFDVNQGELGNCWFLAAIGNLVQHKDLFQRVICNSNNDFNRDNYCGLFHFKFWHFGEWVDILIDDRLPTQNGELVFVQSNARNEFWPPLLEKAYAKLYGGYDKLIGGFVAEAFTDLTGGVTETYDLKIPPPNFFNMLLKAYKRNVLMGCGKSRYTGNVGIPEGHAYSVSNVTRIMDAYGNVTELVRIRNPWGNSHEYTGPFSDKSEKWNKVSHQEKERIGFIANSDGEFWMAFNDFLCHFDNLDICNLTPDMLTREPHIGREWKVTAFQEVWTKDSRIRHEFLAVDPDPDDNEDYCTVVVAVMHISRNRKDRKKLGLKMTCGNDKTFFKLAKPENYFRRENVFRFDLLPGQYHIEIHPFDTQDNFEYLYRVFYETTKTYSIYPTLRDVPTKFSTKKLNKSSKKARQVKPVKYYSQKKHSKSACKIM